MAVPLPRLLAAPNTSVPALTFTGPVNVLVAASVVLPEPSWENWPPPTMAFETVTASDRRTANVAPVWVTMSLAVPLRAPTVPPLPS